MEDVKRGKCVHKVSVHMHKKRVLTSCCCAGSGEEGVMEDLKRDKCAHKVDGHTHKSKIFWVHIRLEKKRKLCHYGFSTGCVYMS